MTHRAAAAPRSWRRRRPRAARPAARCRRSSRHAARISGPPRPVDGPVDPTPTQQRAVRGVHHRIRRHRGDVGHLDPHPIRHAPDRTRGVASSHDQYRTLDRHAPSRRAAQAPERGGERETLEGFLDFQRASVVWKATGLSDADAARRLLPSLTTVSGLIRHLADVERSWFREDLDGQQNVPYPVLGRRSRRRVQGDGGRQPGRHHRRLRGRLPGVARGGGPLRPRRPECVPGRPLHPPLDHPPPDRGNRPPPRPPRTSSENSWTEPPASKS